MRNKVKSSSFLLRLALPHLQGISPYLPYLTSLQAVSTSPKPHVVARFGENGVLDQTLTQVFELNGPGDLRQNPLDGSTSSTPSKGSVTCQKLMLAALRLALADSEANWQEAEPLLAENCVAYGIKGKSEILEAKRKNFFTKRNGKSDAYDVNMFSCDLENMMVSFHYECFLTGMEGRGTELVFFQEDGLILKIVCIRHKQDQAALFKSCPLCSN